MLFTKHRIRPVFSLRHVTQCVHPHAHIMYPAKLLMGVLRRRGQPFVPFDIVSNLLREHIHR